MRVAWLQRATTLGGIALAAGWGWWWWQRGRPWLALAGAVLILGSYAAVLALEFGLMAWQHRDDPAPRATRRQLLRAWWGETTSSPRVFCWRGPFASRRWPDHLPADARGRRGVLLVHGFLCNRGIWNRWLRRLTAADVPFVAVDLEPVFGEIGTYAAIVDDAVRRLEAATGLPPLAVAHSMGGLALRAWWARPGNVARLAHAVTIATPHRGTWLARFAVSHNARQMQLGSPWITALTPLEDAAIAARSTCFYGHCDNIVFPPVNATMPGADNRHLSGVAHVQMVDVPEPWEALEALLVQFRR